MRLNDERTEPERPNKHTDRVAWNTHSERTIRRKYVPYSYPEIPWEKGATFDLSWKPLDLADTDVEIARTIKEIIRSEGILITLALENLVYGSVEAVWEAMDAGKKKELVLEGLYRRACTARSDSRISCPEMTIAGLIGDGEYKLSNLVRNRSPCAIVILPSSAETHCRTRIYLRR
jgi:hypothetical protein